MPSETPQKPLIYVTRDIERALGIAPGPSLYIVTNKTPYSEEIKKQYPDFITLIHAPGLSLGTGQLLENSATKELISRVSDNIVVFKNSLRIEGIVQQNGWKLMNPPANLSEKIENKITQVEWLGNLREEYLPLHIVKPTRNLHWNGEPRILQWAHGHTGDGTIKISSENELKYLQEKFPDRLTRSTAVVNGPSFTVNVVIASNKILISNVSYQITGISPFTENSFTTVGNDWSLPPTLLTDSELEMIEKMADRIGVKMQSEGWRGLFGIDVMRDVELNRIYLIEINARQPASTTFESFLQEENRRKGVIGLTTAEAHLKALLGEEITTPLIPVNDGAQVVQRVTSRIKKIFLEKIETLKSQGFKLVTYPNYRPNTDLLRIQSLKGIMVTDGKLNERGREIIKILEA